MTPRPRALGYVVGRPRARAGAPARTYRAELFAPGRRVQRRGLLVEFRGEMVQPAEPRQLGVFGFSWGLKSGRHCRAVTGFLQALFRRATDEVVAEITADPGRKRDFEAFVHWLGRFVERRGGQKMPVTTKMLLGALVWSALEGGGGFADVVRALKEDAEADRSGAA